MLNLQKMCTVKPLAVDSEDASCPRGSFETLYQVWKGTAIIKAVTQREREREREREEKEIYQVPR